jgi:hypothetical protein
VDENVLNKGEIDRNKIKSCNMRERLDEGFAKTEE